MMSDVPHYHINLFFSEDDDGWIAAVPDLQNANAHGRSPEEALREIKVVMEMWIESWLENHDSPPPASYWPAPFSQAG
jgi:predicted RNase H-like HicB family nuclease